MFVQVISKKVDKEIIHPTTNLTTNYKYYDIYSSDAAWWEILQKTTIGDILTPNRKIVTVHYDEEVKILLKKLADANVISAIITDPSIKPGVLGFVDVLDLLVFIVDNISNEIQDITKESIQNLKWAGQCFSRTIAGELINYSQSDPYKTITNQTLLLEVVTLFAGEYKRLAVVEGNKIVNVISQSDIIEFLTTCGVYIGSKILKTIKEILTPSGVATVNEKMNIISTLRYMKNIKVSGVAVVDDHHRIIANFSATDLIGLTEDNFHLLSLSIKEFVYKIHGFPKPPVFVLPNDSIETVMLKLVVHKVHRVYIVNPEMKPIGIITLTDIMKFLLMNLNFFFVLKK
jgi:5'-AMP-activated protein kinase regulatory gamma subunit